MRDTVRVFYL